MMIIFFGSASGDLVLKRGKIHSALLAGLTMLFVIPNVLWGISFAVESHRYQSDQLQYHQELKKHPAKGTEYNKPFAAVADWFQRNSDSSEVIISRWKELGMMLPGKKILLMDAFISLDMFEQSIRDYGVKYIVTSKDDIGWHGFEFQMNLTNRYSFILVQSVADFDIFEIRAVSLLEPRKVETEKVFQYMFSHLQNGRYDTLRSFFSKNAPVVALQPYLRFYSGVVLECAGELDSALNIFDQLYRLPQGIAIGQQLGFHRNVIDKRKSAERSGSTMERTALYLNIALNYWELDLRHISYQFLDRSLSVDSNYIPAYSLYIYFLLTDLDTAEAKKVFAGVQKQFPNEIITSLFASAFSRMDSLRRTMQDVERSGMYLRLAEDFRNLGLSENALEAMRNAHLLNKRDPLLALRLSDMYDKKSKFYPSLKLLNQANSINPNPRLQKKILEIEDRY
jgi:tetratricopeptide (TPR) repeat protein